MVGLKYKEAMTHFEFCPMIKRPCKFECGQNVQSSDLEAHFKECPKYSQPCPKCETDVLVNGPNKEEHDCLSALKIEKLALEQKKEEYLISLTGSKSTLNLKCLEGHKMKSVRGSLIP